MNKTIEEIYNEEIYGEDIKIEDILERKKGKIAFQFPLDVETIEELYEAIAKEKNGLMRAIMQRPVMYVDVFPTKEADCWYLEFSIGFDGVDIKEFQFGSEEKCHNLNEAFLLSAWFSDTPEIYWGDAISKLRLMNEN